MSEISKSGKEGKVNTKHENQCCQIMKRVKKNKILHGHCSRPVLKGHCLEKLVALALIERRRG